MKRKKLGMMNVKDEDLLSRDEMRHIMAGSGCNVCRIFTTYGGWSDCNFGSNEAADWEDQFSEITGYCCASCGSGQFSNAEPCY